MKNAAKEFLLSILLGIFLPAAALSIAVKALPESAPDPLPASDPAETSSEPSAAAPDETIAVLLADGTVQAMEISDYLTGVLLSEVPASFEPEALKAQAVVSRTYALRKTRRSSRHAQGAVCTDPACCQGYLSPDGDGDVTAPASNIAKLRQAVDDTAGQVLTYNGELIEATFFSCSGGNTEDAVAVWGDAVPFLQAVPSPGEEIAAHVRDTVTFTPDEFARLLGIDPDGSPENWFGPILRTEGDGIDSAEIGGICFSGTELRTRLGLRSTDITFEPAADSITVTTYGYGHRVGMSQYGAQAMALSGADYTDILSHYYVGAVLETEKS